MIKSRPSRPLLWPNSSAATLVNPWRSQALSTAPRLRSPLWRWGAIAAMGTPLLVAIGISQGGLSLPLPPCLFRALLGFPAPSCGLTRAFLALAQGDWALALSYHLFAPLLMALLGAIVVISAGELLTRRSWLALYRRWLPPATTLSLITLFLGYYALRLWARYTLPSLPWGLEETAIWQHFLTGALAL